MELIAAQRLLRRVLPAPREHAPTEHCNRTECSLGPAVKLSPIAHLPVKGLCVSTRTNAGPYCSDHPREAYQRKEVLTHNMGVSCPKCRDLHAPLQCSVRGSGGLFSFLRLQFLRRILMPTHLKPISLARSFTFGPCNTLQ